MIASCAFGIEVNSFRNPDNEFHKIAMEAANFGNFFTILKLIGYMVAKPVMKALKISISSKKAETFFRETVHDAMKVREEKEIVRYDMINLLMQAKKGQLSNSVKEKKMIIEGFATVEESQVGQVKTVWDDDDLAAQALIFFLAGFDPVKIF